MVVTEEWDLNVWIVLRQAAHVSKLLLERSEELRSQAEIKRATARIKETEAAVAQAEAAP